MEFVTSHTGHPAPTSLKLVDAGESNVDVVSTNAQQSIVHRSRSMHELISQSLSFARSSATVLISGESGTGKEMFARLIHESSQRGAGRFACVNCAALSESLMESELFGHERGAFTGADQRRAGRFEWADGGTLLLDEISEVPVSIQAKLLRVLEENEFQRVGSNENIPADVRIVATSNKDLIRQVERGEFREDLFYRLNVLRIILPALRERREDIPLLANQFFHRFRSESSYPLRGLSTATLTKLSKYHWPGNVRQLRNAIHRACIVSRGDHIEPRDLPALDYQCEREKLPDWVFGSRLDEIERQVILECLLRCEGNKTEVAGRLGVTTRTLANKLKLYRERGQLTAVNEQSFVR